MTIQKAAAQRTTLDAVKIKLDSAQDLVQLITEDLEDNFVRCSDLPSMVRARAEINLSALYVLSEFLRGVGQEIEGLSGQSEAAPTGRSKV